MTANDLRDLLIKFCAMNDGRNGKHKVAVKTAGGICGVNCSLVTHLVNGGDWNAGKLFMVTKDRLVVEPKK